MTIPWGQQRWRLGKGIGLRCPGWPSHKPLSIRLSIRSYGNVSPINQPINASLSNSPWVFSSPFLYKAQNGMKLDPPMRLFICHPSPPTIERWRNLVRIAFGWMDRLLCNLMILHMHALQCVKCQFEISFSEKSLNSFYSLFRWQMDGIINLKCQLVVLSSRKKRDYDANFGSYSSCFLLLSALRRTLFVVLISGPKQNAGLLGWHLFFDKVPGSSQ